MPSIVSTVWYAPEWDRGEAGVRLLGDAQSRAVVADPDVPSARAWGSVVVVLIGAQTFVVSPERRVALAVVFLPGVLALGMSAAAIKLAARRGRAARGVAFGGRRRSVGHAAGSRHRPTDEWMVRVGAGSGVAVGALRTAPNREGLVSEIER
jgi:hypothetical protein